ncbi:MAG: hypothetical protein E7597_00295 [Ruminococcaceae bacterium]|nr:hypothetical protein [Oscillospiraceae bacterium]
MKIRAISLLLTLCFLLGTFCSCGGADGDKEVYNIDASNDVSDSIDIDFSFESKGISEGLYRYIYKYYKNFYIDICDYIVQQNGRLSQTAVITVADNEAFWNAVVPADVHGYFKSIKSQYHGTYQFEVNDEDVGSYTFADLVFDHANAESKEYLIYNALASQYDYVPSRDFAEYDVGLEATLTDEITGKKDKIAANEEVTDANGVVLDWAKNRWEVYLAGQGITKEEWVSLYFDFPVLLSNLPAHIVEKEFGDLGDDATDDEVVNYYLEQINNAQVSFDYICYDLLSEENYNKQKQEATEESSEEFLEESSEENSWESSEQISEDSIEELSEESSEEVESVKTAFDPLVLEAETYEEYLKLRKDACQEIYDSIINGTKTFESALQESPYYEMIKEETADVRYLENADFYEWFGKQASEIEVGGIDIFVKQERNSILILRYYEVEAEDYTDEDISLIAEGYFENYKKSLQSKSMNAVFEAAYAYIGNIDLSNDYSKPWKID